MNDRFIYHALAIGISGRITTPFDEIIPTQPSSALPEGGGFGTSRVNNFQFRHILRFTRATTLVAGADTPAQNDIKGPSHDAVATAIVEGLDILGVVTADRIVARIASSHPFDPQQPGSIYPVGSYFENLRIAGYKVDIDLATDRFLQFDTTQKIRDAYKDNTDHFRDEFKQMSLIGRGEQIPERLHKYFPYFDWISEEKIPEKNGIIACSLVRNIAGLGRDVTQCGHTMMVKGFGIVRLAELKITQSGRRIRMLQVDLGSTPSGDASACGAEGNGDGY
jgi:hypothetical protein